MTMTDIDKALAIAKAHQGELFGSWREMINDDPVAMIDVSPDGSASLYVVPRRSAVQAVRAMVADGIHTAAELRFVETCAGPNVMPALVSGAVRCTLRLEMPEMADA
jgi:hypothetical protein